MPSEGRRARQHSASQQPKFTHPLAFLPSQQQFSSMQTVHQNFRFSALFGSELCLFCNHLLDFLSQQGATVGLSRSDWLAGIVSTPTSATVSSLSPQNTQVHLIPANHSGFTTGFYITIKTHPGLIPHKSQRFLKHDESVG